TQCVPCLTLPRWYLEGWKGTTAAVTTKDWRGTQYLGTVVVEVGTISHPWRHLSGSRMKVPKWTGLSADTPTKCTCTTHRTYVVHVPTLATASPVNAGSEISPTALQPLGKYAAASASQKHDNVGAGHPADLDKLPRANL
ncbi:hypothetical protein ACRALDRAFT_207147, partial [Sodiomyces alcalophilus JCM 7366]|uniref:uncharacterized protein n=1 Tax=Sodiomyces alcalophilus JCM 7366 TaxID=591952 RepID=UPI0039B545A0